MEPPLSTKRTKKLKRSLIAAMTLLAIASIYAAVWIRLPRSFQFVRDNGGVETPWDSKKTVQMDGVICYGFTVDPIKVQRAMNAELRAGNWIPMMGEEMDNLFTRADLTPSQHEGIPTQEVSNFYDNAGFENDGAMLRIPDGMTSIFWVNRRTNFSEMFYRFQHRNDPPRESN